MKTSDPQTPPCDVSRWIMLDMEEQYATIPNSRLERLEYPLPKQHAHRWTESMRPVTAPLPGMPASSEQGERQARTWLADGRPVAVNQGGVADVVALAAARRGLLGVGHAARGPAQCDLPAAARDPPSASPTLSLRGPPSVTCPPQRVTPRQRHLP